MFNDTLNYFFYAVCTLVLGVYKLVNLNDALLAKSRQLLLSDKPSVSQLYISKELPQIIYFDPRIQCHVLERFYLVFNANRFCLADKDQTPILPFNDHNYIIHNENHGYVYPVFDWLGLFKLVKQFSVEIMGIAKERLELAEFEEDRDTFIMIFLVFVLVAIGCFCFSQKFPGILEKNHVNVQEDITTDVVSKNVDVEGNLGLVVSTEELSRDMIEELSAEVDFSQNNQDIILNFSTGASYDDDMVYELLTNVQDIYTPKAIEDPNISAYMSTELSVKLENEIDFISVSDNNIFDPDVEFVREGFFIDLSSVSAFGTPIKEKEGEFSSSSLSNEVPPRTPSPISESKQNNSELLDSGTSYDQGNLIDLLELDGQEGRTETKGNEFANQSGNLYELKSGKLIDSAKASLHYGTTADIVTALEVDNISRPNSKDRESTRPNIVEQFIIRERSRPLSEYSIESDISDQVSHVSVLPGSSSGSSIKLNSLLDDIANNSIHIDDDGEEKAIIELNTLLEGISNSKPTDSTYSLEPSPNKPDELVPEDLVSSGYLQKQTSTQNILQSHLASLKNSKSTEELNYDNIENKENVYINHSTELYNNDMISSKSVPSTPKHKTKFGRLEIFSNKLNHMRPYSNEDSQPLSENRLGNAGKVDSIVTPVKLTKLSKLSFSNLKNVKNLKNGAGLMISTSKPPIKSSPIKSASTPEISVATQKYLLSTEDKAECDQYLEEVYGIDESDTSPDSDSSSDPASIVPLLMAEAIQDEQLSQFIESLFIDFEGKESSANWLLRSQSIDRIRYLIKVGPEDEQLNEQVIKLISSNVMSRVDDLVKLTKTNRSVLLKKSILFLRDLVIYNNDRDLKSELFTKLIRSLFPLTRTTNNKFIVNSSTKSLCLMIGAINISDFIVCFKDNFQASLISKISDEKYAVLQTIKFFICQNKNKFIQDINIENKEELSFIDQLILKLLPYVTKLSSDANEKVRSEIVEIYLIISHLFQPYAIEKINDFYDVLSSQFKKRIEPPAVNSVHVEEEIPIASLELAE